MTNSLITVATCTLGPSGGRLDTYLGELRRFTALPFRQVVVDDGTESESSRMAQQMACDRHGAEWFENPGPTYGISYAWNHALEQIRTPWAFCLEDGLRPSMGWLETAVDFVQRIGSKRWGPQQRRVGMAGFCHLQDWMLSLGDAWPGGRDVMDVFRGENEDFLASGWNDGLWCWSRMLPGMQRSINSEAAERWTNDVAIFRDLARGEVSPLIRHPTDIEQAWQKWRLDNHWPQRRQAWCGWYPGAFMLVNMEAWRRVGRFRDGVTFFEGHLGTRMGMNGYLSLCVEGPPWLHTPSLGFKASGVGKNPRHHDDTREAFVRDFGEDSMDAPNVLATGVVSIDEQMAVNAELAGVELFMDDRWKRWL